MDIKLISFPDKVTGASDATGKIAADDVNQIKKILNAVVSALFPLDNTNTATSAVLKVGALPAVDIFTNNFSTDFVVSGGVIALSGLPQLPIAPPLTNGVVDDDANTFTGTLPAGYAVTDLEATFNGGTSWATITALPLEVGDVALAIGQVGLRIKATSERQHSATLYNATAFISSAGNTDPDTGFAAITIDPAKLDKFSVSNGNNLSNVPGSNGAYSYGVLSTQKIPAGGVGNVRCNVDPTKASGANNSPYLGLSISADIYNAGANNVILPLFTYHKASNTQGSFGGNYIDSTGTKQYFFSNTQNITVQPRLQIRTTGTRIYAEYSLDGGNNWTDAAPAYNIAQPAQDIYLHFYCEAYQITDQADLLNIIQSGMINT